MKTICIDFDGVIYKNLVYQGTTTIKGSPIEGAKVALQELSRDYKIVINSSRFETDEGMDAVREWLIENDMDYELSKFKPTAHIYLDDRGIQFQGDWTKSIQDIKSFVQWQEGQKRQIRRNKREFGWMRIRTIKE